MYANLKILVKQVLTVITLGGTTFVFELGKAVWFPLKASNEMTGITWLNGLPLEVEFCI